MGVSLSLDVFAAKVTTYKNRQSESHIKQVKMAEARFTRQLVRASTKAAGPDRVLSGVGAPAGFATRKGSRLGFKFIRHSPVSLEVRKTGAWQFVDSTVGGGSTAPHTIEADNKRNPRPLPPATRIRPTMRGRKDGVFSRGVVNHPGSARFPYWGQAIRLGSGEVTTAFGKAFVDIGNQVF